MRRASREFIRAGWIVVALAGIGEAQAQAECVQEEIPAAPIPGRCDPTPPPIGIAGEPEAPYSCAEARVLFVDFPLWLPAPTTGPVEPGAVVGRFEDNLAARLEAAVDPGWLCEAGDCGDPCRASLADGVGVEVSAVLPPRDVNGRRADGDRRFWRIRFRAVGEVVDPYLPVLGASQCEAVSALREIVDELAPEYGLTPAQAASVKVGREACNVQPMASAARWHLQAIEAESPREVPIPAEADRPQIALIDTGVSRGQVPSADLLARVPEPSTQGVHTHGDAMLALIREVVPEAAADVRAWRVMDGDGVGVTALTALAVDEALYDLDPARPLLMNLSLGWLPEYERPRTLRGPGCAIEEDGVGASVRYMLTVAREADTVDRPVLAVAAAGNRPLNGERPELFKVEAALPVDACTESWWADEERRRPPMLFPGEYSRMTVRDDQRAGCEGGEPLSLAVGAIDHRDRPTGMSIPRALAEPPLVAPGSHVRLSAEQLPGGEEVLTGTSVSAALTTGAAARALATLGAARQLRGGQAQLDGAAIGRLLYLTARGLGRTTWQGPEVRALSVGALDRLIQCEALDDVLACVAQARDDELLEACGRWLADCDALPQPPQGFDPEGRRPAPSCVSRVSDPGAAACLDWTDCVDHDALRFGPPQAAHDAPDRLRREALGAVGPQPGIPMCPDCVLDELFPYMDVSITFSSKYSPLTTRFTSPYLLLTDKYGKQAYIPLDTPSNSYGFSPGDSASYARVPVPKSLVNIEKAQLVATITQYGKIWAVDTAAMQIK